ncbi:YtxH domain-containing protein [Paenibacillus sp. CMAA1364]
MKDNNKSFICGALVGSFIGSITALLLAPKPGSELRKDIVDTTRQVSNKTQELANVASAQGANVYSIVKGKATDIAQEVQSWRPCKKEESDEVI